MDFNLFTHLLLILLLIRHQARSLSDFKTVFHTVKIYKVKPDKQGIPHSELASTQPTSTTFTVSGKRIMEYSGKFKSMTAYDITSSKTEVEGTVTTYTLGIHSVMRGDDNLMFISLVGNKVVGVVESLTAQDVLMKFE